MMRGTHNVTLTHCNMMRGTHNVTLTHCNMMHGTHSVTLTHCNMMHGTHNVKLQELLHQYEDSNEIPFTFFALCLFLLLKNALHAFVFAECGMRNKHFEGNAMLSIT